MGDYLTLCAKSGIFTNESKFQFCKDTVEFAGLKITPTGVSPTGVSPTDTILNAIQNFPQLSDIIGARTWFGLVNEITWAYSISSIMQPFCKLVKANSKFTWNNTLTQTFENSKQIWSLDHAQMFVLGCKELVISTDHKHLLGILNIPDINPIVNTCISNLKHKTLRYHFATQYNPGKWKRGADTL